MIGDLLSNSGVWSVIVWVCIFLIMFILVYVLKTKGEGDAPIVGNSAKPYLSGNVLPDREMHHFAGSNLYWGFQKAFKKYYDVMVPIHNGCVNDYVYWFVGVLAIILVLIGGSI